MIDLGQYLPILLFLGVALAISCVFVFLPMGVSRLTGTHNPTAEKLSEYECGFPAFEEPRSQFDVRFYLVAILFIIFDLEAAFLVGLGHDDDLHRRTGHRPDLCMESGRAGVGVILPGGARDWN